MAGYQKESSFLYNNRMIEILTRFGIDIINKIDVTKMKYFENAKFEAICYTFDMTYENLLKYYPKDLLDLRPKL